VTDPYGTAALRERVLAAWTASPARFREDANAEEDAATGSPLVEIAQNAHDAAVRAGVPGRLLVEVVDGTLYAANTGAPLDAAGVEALSHLRASTKAAGSVGRYGVGFKAVLAVTDAPAIHGRHGGVRWSRAETADAVAEVHALAAEAARRAGVVPVMRLPFPAEPDEHAAALLRMYDTVVVLPLTAPVDLGEVDETLLLTLPLESLRVGDRTLVRDPAAVVHTASGEVPPGLLADRPVEERERGTWTVTVAVPAPADRLLRAPQPTAERVDVPVFLSVSVPLEPSRKHVVHGPLSEWLAARAAEAYVGLLESLPHTPDVLDLVPATLPAGPFDLALREALAPLLPEARVFPDGRRAVLDLGPATDAVTNVLGLPLLDPTWLRRRPALAALGVRVLDTADVVDLLNGLDPPSWAAVYEALANVPDRDALRALPVPLADGRLVTGPRGLLIPDDPDLVAASAAAGLPLRWIDPEACAGRAGEVLRGAGALPAEAGAVLDAIRAEVEDSLDAEDPAALAAFVLRLLRNDPAAARDREWLGNLALPADDADLRAADELLLPGSPLVGWMREDSPFGVASSALLDDYGADALLAAGVVGTLTARDLEEVRPDAWAAALGSLTDLDDLDWLRANVLLPAADGTLHPPRHLLADDADPLLDGLYDRVGPLSDASRRVVARLGLVTTVEAMDDDALASLADRLADRPATLAQVRALYAALARADVPLDPTRVRAVRDGEVVVVPVDEAYAVDRPDLLPLLAGRAWLPVDVTLGAALADVLGVRLASSLPARVTSTRTATERHDGIGYDVHGPLLVNDVPVAWWAAPPSTDGTPGGLARLVAWHTGGWPARHAIEATLRGDRDDESLLDPL
jgi:transposase